MAKTTNISSSVARTGFQNSKQELYYFKQSEVKKRDPFKIRQGEILKGEILAVYTNSEALVRLPIGTFQSELHNRLKKGDELFFEVQASNPSLVLKVHSVTSKINTEYRKPDDICRMLELPDSRIYIDLIVFLQSRRNIIERNQVLIIIKNFNALTPEIKEFKSETEIFRTYFWLNESNLIGSNENFKKYFPLFQNGDFTKDILIKLYYDIKNSEEAEKYKSLLRIINPNTSIKRLITFFSKDSNFYIWLDKLISDSKAPKSAIQLMNILESMNDWNQVALIAGNSFQIIFPIPFKKDFITLKLILMNFISERDRQRRQTGEMETDPAKIIALGKISEDLQLKSSDSIEDLSINLMDFIQDLNLVAKYNNMSIQALILHDENGNERDLLPGKFVTSSRNFSIVV